MKKRMSLLLLSSLFCYGLQGMNTKDKLFILKEEQEPEITQITLESEDEKEKREEVIAESKKVNLPLFKKDLNQFTQYNGSGSKTISTVIYEIETAMTKITNQRIKYYKKLRNNKPLDLQDQTSLTAIKIMHSNYADIMADLLNVLRHKGF